MILYLIIFLIPVITYYISSEKQRSHKFLLITMIFLGCFVGFSDMFGGFDRYIYGELFDLLADDIRTEVPLTETALMQFYGAELGYVFLNYIIALFTRNRYIFITILTFIIYINYYIAFKRHIKNYPFAVVMFLTFTFFFTFTYIRQLIGVSIALLSIKYLIERKTWKFFAIMLLVATMHKSGIIFSLMFFIPQKLYPKRFVLLILGICALIGISGITSGLYDAYVETAGLQNFAGTNDYNAEEGARLAYFIEVVFFASIILLNYEKINPTHENVIFTNMAFMFCAILLLFIRSEDGGRLSWYFIFGIYYTISLIFSKNSTELDTDKNQLYVRYNVNPIFPLCTIIVFVFLYFRIFFAWQVVMNLYPYKTYFTNGHREGDSVYEFYEYDEKYDVDKFYR